MDAQDYELYSLEEVADGETELTTRTNRKIADCHEPPMPDYLLEDLEAEQDDVYKTAIATSL